MSATAAALVAAVLVGAAALVLLVRERPLPGPPAPPARPAGAPPPLDAPLVLDLVAAVVEAGAPPLAAVRAVARVLVEAGSPAGEHLARSSPVLGPGAPPAAGGPPLSRRAAADLDQLLAPLARCLALAEQAGAPVAVLLRSSADELLRRQRRRAGALAAARLGVRVVAPLGLCTLPAFGLLAVVPVLLSLGQDLLRG